MSEADRIKREHPAGEEEEIKPTMFDGRPMFETEEEFEDMKKSLDEDLDVPKGQ